MRFKLTPTANGGTRLTRDKDAEARKAYGHGHAEHAVQTTAIKTLTGRACANCAESVARAPVCGMCIGPTGGRGLTRWHPLPVLQQNNDAK